MLVGPGLVSTSPAFTRGIDSHPAGPHGRLAQKTVIGPPLLGSGGVDIIYLHRVYQTAVTAPPRVGGVVWILSVIFPLNLFILSQIVFPRLRSCMSFVIFISCMFICSLIFVCTIFFCLIYSLLCSSLFVTSLQFLYSLLSFFLFLISFLISSFTHGASDFL